MFHARIARYSPTMERTDLLAALARDGAAFGDSCEEAGLVAPAESCAGWSVADLVWHLTAVHQFWRTVVGEKLPDREGYVRPERVADADLLATYRAGLAATIAVLTEADPDSEVWTWSTDHTVGFVIRRLAHETAVHCWDAQVAAGAPVAVEAHLASDGIDEFLTHFIGEARADALPVDGSVHLHCGDVPGEWTLRPRAGGSAGQGAAGQGAAGQGAAGRDDPASDSRGDPGDDRGFDLTREHAKGDCAIRGSASDILLALWRRIPTDAVDLVGDTAMAERFIARTSLE